MPVLALLAFALLAGFAPPSGRPPIGPLERFEPKRYDLSFGVTLSTLQQNVATDRQNFELAGAPIVMPVIFLGTFNRVASESVSAKLWLNSGEADPHLELKTGYPHSTHMAVLTVEQFRGQTLRWELDYAIQVWSSRINDEKAAEIAWPEKWPTEVKDGLRPQMYIESDDPLFAQAVQTVSEGKLRQVPPYLAAKDLIRYCVNQIQVSGDGVVRGEFRVLRGLDIVGAKQAAQDKRGSPHDLVCVCVAMLRAGGIPARPVIGITEEEKGKPAFVSWAEFYLPDAGWVPFDPNVMRGKGIRTLDVRKAWPEFGTMKELNQRVPLAYHFIPPATVETPQYPAVWGWDPRPGKDPGSQQQVQMNLTSRGKGEEDPG